MKSDKLFYTSILISGTILFISLVLGLYISNEINRTSESIKLENSIKDYDYHIMVLLDKSHQGYSESFMRGVTDAALKYNVAAEIINIDGKNYIDEVLEKLDMAMYAKVDGIIVHAYLDDRIINKINAATDIGIPVITLNEDLPQSQRKTYVGVSRYNIGLVVGKTIAEATNGKGEIAVIEQKNFADINYDSSDVTNLLILGIEDVFKSYEDLSLSLVTYTEQGVLSAETIATEILEENPNINGIYCTDIQSTLGIMQVLIDKNLVKDISLVGFGEDEEILNYIENGKIIDATIITNYEYIGSDAIRALYEYKTTEVPKDHMNTPLQVVNKSNIDSYKKEKGIVYEKND